MIRRSAELHFPAPTSRARFIIASCAMLLAVQACEGATPESTPLPTGGGAGSSADAGLDAEAGAPSCTDEGIAAQDNAACQPLATDYRPADTANDTWAACISDDNQYHPFDPNISSIPRVGAFEQIAKLLSFGGATAPSAQAFLDARLAYQTDQGLESRVSRREDEHYSAAPDACNKLTAAQLAQYPDRCAGPAKIQPMLNAAFQQGISGVDPVKNAARVEAGLLWFLYLSVYKESKSCASTVGDCDSSWAYYSGGEPRSGGLGLSRYVRARSPQAHDRVWDGLLAVRCWRDLDNPTGAAQNTAMRDQALAQLDRALLRGVALVVRQRAQKLPCEAAWESVRILGEVLGREAAARDPSSAQVLSAELSKASVAEVKASAIVGAIDASFACP
jgi:hypothetical protein